MAVYADEEHGYDGDGDSSETSTEQELKQKNVGSGESTNDNCGTNSIDGGLALTICGEIEIGADGDGVAYLIQKKKLHHMTIGR